MARVKYRISCQPNTIGNQTYNRYRRKNYVTTVTLLVIHLYNRSVLSKDS